MQAEPRTGLRPGAVVAGLYQVDEKVGEGASGEVWSATNTQSGGKVALKALFSAMIADEEVVARFRREAFFLARAKSDYVAKIYEFINDPVTGMVLVMEFIEGESLAQIFDRRILSVEQAIAIGLDILSGVADLHSARIIHRDLKPANILMQPQPGGKQRAVICDFSLSRLAKRRPRDGSTATALTELTRGDVALGTVRYMAPEQVLNSRQATERSDLYAVGSILYRGLAGVHAFSEYQTIRQIARAKVTGESRPLETGRKDAVAKGVEAVVGKALRRKPAERYQEAGEMRAALQALVAHSDVVERDTQHMRASRPSPEGTSSSGPTSSGSSTPISSGSIAEALPSDSAAAVAPTTPRLPEELKSVQVTFDSLPPKGRRRRNVLLGVGGVAIFAAGIFAGRLWALGGAIGNRMWATEESTSAPLGPSPSAIVAENPAPSVAVPKASTPPASASGAPAPAGSASPAGSAAPTPSGSAAAVVGDAAVADLEGPTMELPDSPPRPEHHHHSVPSAELDTPGAAASAASADAGKAQPTAASGAGGAEAGAPSSAKLDAGSSVAQASARKSPQEDDFENPYDTPGPRAAPKPKSDAPPKATPVDAGASLGF
jgi:eukaryotic-like serine/threonine-protein kinase